MAISQAQTQPRRTSRSSVVKSSAIVVALVAFTYSDALLPAGRAAFGGVADFLQAAVKGWFEVISDIPPTALFLVFALVISASARIASNDRHRSGEAPLYDVR